MTRERRMIPRPRWFRDTGGVWHCRDGAKPPGVRLSLCRQAACYVEPGPVSDDLRVPPRDLRCTVCHGVIMRSLSAALLNEYRRRERGRS
jgi:hypothetical protein